MDPVTLGLIIGGSSLLSDIFTTNSAKKQRETAINAYKKLLIPYYQTQAKADKVGDTIYTKVMGELNSGAFAYKGALNPNILNSIALSKIATTRANAEVNVIQRDEEYNRNIRSQIAGIEAQPLPEINPFNAIAAGIEGYLGGKQLQMAEDLSKSQNDYLNLLKSTISNNNTTTNTTIPQVNTNTNSSFNKYSNFFGDFPTANNEIFDVLNTFNPLNKKDKFNLFKLKIR